MLLLHGVFLLRLTFEADNSHPSRRIAKSWQRLDVRFGSQEIRMLHSRSQNRKLFSTGLQHMSVFLADNSSSRLHSPSGGIYQPGCSMGNLHSSSHNMHPHLPDNDFNRLGEVPPQSRHSYPCDRVGHFSRNTDL